MVEIAEALRILIEQIILTFGYPGIFLGMFAENFFPPLPSEMMMTFTGFLVSQGRLTLVGAMFSGTAGMILGALGMYYIGWWLDERVLRVLVRRYGRWIGISEHELNRVLSLMNRYGGWLIVFGRFIPIVRAFIALPAGMSRMPVRKFLVFVSIGSLLYNGVQIAIGMIVGENWEIVLSFLDQYDFLVLAGLIALAIAAVIFLLLRSRAQAA